MISNRGKINRVAAGLLTVWMTVLSVCIHSMHHHPGEDFFSPAVHERARDLHDQTPANRPPEGKTNLADSPGNSTYSGVFYCPACLFIKTCNQRAVVWTSPITDVAPQKQIPSPEKPGGAYVVLVCIPPRAPPASS